MPSARQGSAQPAACAFAVYVPDVMALWDRTDVEVQVSLLAEFKFYFFIELNLKKDGRAFLAFCTCLLT